MAGTSSDTGTIVPSTTSSTSTLSAAKPSLEPLPMITFDDILPQMSSQAVSELSKQGFPSGLVHEMARTKVLLPLRFWIIDNSSSMQVSDGQRLQGRKSAVNRIDGFIPVQAVPCTRWVELQDTVNHHIQLAELLGVPTVFRFLNALSAPHPQEFVVGAPVSMKDALVHQWQVKSMAAAPVALLVDEIKPLGVTPLTEAIETMHRRVESVSNQLTSLGGRAVVVICTDGLPTDESGKSTDAAKQEFIDALESLQQLPVWLVIRLCTNNQEVVEFYNTLDNPLELEVMDDYFGEAAEIFDANQWLTYGLPLHRCREMGLYHRLFDLLDERLLTKDELVLFIAFLFGARACRGTLDPHKHWNDFLHGVACAVRQQSEVFNPQTKRMDDWIDTKRLDSAYGSRGHWCCVEDDCCDCDLDGMCDCVECMCSLCGCHLKVLGDYR